MNATSPHPAVAGERRVPPQPLLALGAIVCVGLARLLGAAGDLWLLLDLAGLALLGTALTMLLRALAGRPDGAWLHELTSAGWTGPLSAACALASPHVGGFGLGRQILLVTAGMGATLTLLIVGGAVWSRLHPAADPATRADGTTDADEGAGPEPARSPAPGVPAVALTVLALVVVTAMTVADAVLR